MAAARERKSRSGLLRFPPRGVTADRDPATMSLASMQVFKRMCLLADCHGARHAACSSSTKQCQTQHIVGAKDATFYNIM